MRDRATMRIGDLASASSAASIFFRRSPTLPPSAMNTSAIAPAFHHGCDVIERRGDGRRRLLHPYAYALHTRKMREQHVRHMRRRRFDQVEAPLAEGGVGHRNCLA